MADAFTICDADHCSVPSSTSPNRKHFVSSYASFEPGTQDRAVTNAGYDDAHPGYEWEDFEDNNLDHVQDVHRHLRCRSR